MSQMYDVADILSKCKLHINRPLTDESYTSSSTDDVWMLFLQEAQDRAFRDLALRVANKMFGAPVLLTSPDSGKTYTFGTDSGLPANYTAITPLTHIEIYPSLAAIPDGPLIEGQDFMMEGALVRMLGNRTRTFAAGPYARFLQSPGVVDATTGVFTLKPPFARVLIQWDAIARMAKRLKQDPSEWEGYYLRDLKSILSVLRNQVELEGAGSADQGSYYDWTYSPDLG